ncbi:hypothetical protein PG995_004829 [Apiospora arundinis]
MVYVDAQAICALLEKEDKCPKSKPNPHRWLSANGSALDVAHNVNNLAAADLIGVGYEPKYPKDEALAAFVQLAVLRLNVKRAMISLIDKTHQMILAEATRNLFVGLAAPCSSVKMPYANTGLK